MSRQTQGLGSPRPGCDTWSSYAHVVWVGEHLQISVPTPGKQEENVPHYVTAQRGLAAWEISVTAVKELDLYMTERTHRMAALVKICSVVPSLFSVGTNMGN